MNKKREFNPKYRRRLEIIDAIILLVLIIISAISILNYDELKVGLESKILGYGFIGFFIITFFLEFLPQALSPLLGVWTATTVGVNIHYIIAVAIFAGLIGACSGFWVGKKYGSRYLPLLLTSESIKKTTKFWKKYGHIYALSTSVTFLPFFSMVFGAIEMSWRDFLTYGLASRVIKYLFFGYLFYFGLWNFVV